ncbi:SMI1/KNR4 family protein [Mesorhizobium australafricanum]|uniref:SMI1/KNR4 family protein n=1 Tax=Mesorhizobium australafricanum TaxID=3072311 RepID=A0ABU4WX45_9HYPH|nr:SMI1/KNR4 family protein [Mesorhizobium sp. VK3E]MDX8440061.1 SMI1/KNR4 family protein [Mesorhizobium sp. VK3E]
MPHTPGGTGSTQLPSLYLDFIERHGASEWDCGDDLVFLWGGEQLIPFNDEYRVQTLTPGLILIGSDGSGEAFGFDLRLAQRPVVQVPFVGMNRKYMNAVAKDFGEWKAMLKPRQDSDSHPGMQLAEVNPVLFGGDTVDPANRVWLTRSQHFEYVRFWNNVFLLASSKSTPQ